MTKASRLSQARSIGEALIALAGCGTVLREFSRPWRSVTFSGQRCEVELRFQGIDEAIVGEALLDELGQGEPLNLAGQLVADVETVSTERIGIAGDPAALSLTITLSVLTLDLDEKQAA